jgi:hypothetical protein
MLSLLNSAFDSARRVLGKRKDHPDASADMHGRPLEDAPPSVGDQGSNKRQQSSSLCSTSSRAWCCRSYSGFQGAQPEAGDARHLVRMGSVSLEMPRPAESSELVALPTDVLQCIYAELALQV